MNLERMRSDIETLGWHVIMVCDDEEGPGFAYSIGLWATFAHPEIIVFGLPIDLMHRIVNLVGEEIQAGHHFASKDFSDAILDGYRVQFGPVDEAFYEEFLGQAINYYGEAAFPVLQCYWPDQEGRFPGEDRCEVAFKQPSLRP